MIIWLMYIDQLYTLYKSYRSSNSVGVIWGHWGQKVNFTKKSYFSHRLHAMVMWLMYIDQLYALYKVMGLEIQPGSFGITEVKSLFLPKMLFPPTDYMLWSCDSSILINYIPSTKVIGLEIQPGSFGVTGVKRSFLTKIIFFIHITSYGHVTQAYWSAR